MEDTLLENWENLPLLTNADAETLAAAAEQVLDAKKGSHIARYCVIGKSDITDYQVIVTARSAPHAKALADELEGRLLQRGVAALHTEGRGCPWQIVDFGTVIVHIFEARDREFYNLDKLYKDTKETAVPAEKESL